MMPLKAEATNTLVELQDAFGVGAVFPTSLLIVPPKNATSTEKKLTEWLLSSCKALKQIQGGGCWGISSADPGGLGCHRGPSGLVASRAGDPAYFP